MENPKKRKTEETLENEKQSGGSFSCIRISAEELRKQLRNPEVHKLLKDYFLESKDENNVSDYINAGGSISEICQLLTDMDLKKREQTCLIFSVLQLIIIRSLTDSLDQDKLNDECKQLISNYMAEFQSILISKTSFKNKKIILRLLATIAAVNSGLAGLILSSLTLTKDDVSALLEHVIPLDDQSLRVSFIHFILAFIIEQSGKVIEKLLSKKVWLPSIFHGLQFDSPFTIKLVLTTLEERLIDSKDLSKTCKLYAFNSWSLIHLSGFYNWDPKVWINNKTHKSVDLTGQISEEDKMEIRILAHGLLMKLCTSVKNGIAFHDPSYLTSGTQRNHTISNFFQKLEQPWDDTLKSELVHQTLSVCPDLLKPLLISFQPRLKVILPKWVEVLKFVIKIVEDLKWDLIDPDPNYYLSIVQDLIVPRQILESISNGQLLKGKNSSEKLTTLKLLFLILNRYNEFSTRVMKAGKNYATFQKSVMPYLINNLPNSFDLLSCLKQSYELKEFDVLKELIKLFTLYEQICPEMVDIIRYDDTVSQWIIEYISSFESCDESDVSLLLSMIRLETIIKPQEAFQEDYLYRFKYTTMAREESDVKLGLDILKELLRRSGIFIRNERELSLWIYCVEKYHHSGIGSLMASSLKWALDNTSAVYKTLLEVQEYSTVNNSFGMNLEDALKVTVNDDGDELDTSVDSMFNLSPLLPSVLQFLSDNSYAENDEFVLAFIVHHLHRQVTVQPFVALLKNYKCPTVEKIMPYVESWLGEPIHLNIPSFSKSLYYYASKSVIAGKKFNCSEAEEQLKDVTSRELLLEECIFMACELSKLGLVTTRRLEKITDAVRVCLGAGVQVSLNHPTLLAGFHPIVDAASSDLTDLVVMVAEQCKLPSKITAPFAHRLAFELKYDKNVCYNFEDDSKLKKLLQIFKFSKSDVEDLMDYVFSMKPKYFERNGKLSQWSMMITYLLKEAVDRNILMTEDSLKNLIDVIVKLTEKGLDTFEMCEDILKYLKLTKTELCGVLLDSARDLFAALSTATVWHEDLCVYIYLRLGKIDYENISLERSITLLASLKKFKKRHKEVLTDASRVLFKGLCERPSPKWLSDLQKLIDPVLSVECCQKTCKHIKKHPKDIFTSIEALSVIKTIFKKTGESYTLYSLVTDWLSEQIQNSKDNSFNQAQSEEMCRILCEILTSDADLSSLSPAENDFVRHLLLNGLELPSQPALHLLLCLVEKKLTKVPPTELFQMLTTHSCFLDVLSEKNSPAKYSCLEIVLALLTKDNSLIKSQHVPAMLSSYGGTLSKMDQINLKILRMYETVGGINLAANWKPHVWGAAARDLYSLESQAVNAKPSANVTLDLLDKNLVARTISAYPLHRKLHDVEEMYEEDGDMYDPAFYLPLMSQVTLEKNIGWKMASSGALALILSSLASADPPIRTAAYHVLHRLYSNTNDHNDNIIWKHFINALRGGIVDLQEEGNVRLSSIVTTFLARASIIMAVPDDPLYFSLHNFIFAKPHLKLSTIPAFFEMFHHTQGNQKLHQRWLLEVIRDGIREQGDLQLTLNSLMFKFILAFHSSCLATPKTKQLIEEIVAKSFNVDEKQLLVNNYSIIPWLSSTKSAAVNNLPQKINSQYKPIIDLIKEKLVST